MTVCLIDKRRRGQQIPSVEMPNHTWFCVLDIDGMDTLVDLVITAIPQQLLRRKQRKWLL